VTLAELYRKQLARDERNSMKRCVEEIGATYAAFPKCRDRLADNSVVSCIVSSRSLVNSVVDSHCSALAGE